MLLAVLSRRAGVRHDQDIFVNVVGGLEARDPCLILPRLLPLSLQK